MHTISKYFSLLDGLKLVRDPIYGFIEVPVEFLPVIDNKLFQRLRWVSQLPLEQLVYPSAQHSRFEHSLGTMYLSMLTAITLLQDGISKKRIYSAIKDDANTTHIPSKKLGKFFVTVAGLVGLLHDVGHAPFSHTLEDATKYTQKDIEYNHEIVGFKISEHILKNYTKGTRGKDEGFREDVAKTVLAVLNKSISLSELSPIQKILRTIIDNVIDVDKGDYVLRDSYHCGVTYGNYGLERLWRHVRITSDYTLGVSPKGAIEAWSLRFARYKMYKNVYKHHVRNITDALLIKILANSFDILDKENLRLVLPFGGTNLQDEETLLRFAFWTDNQFLKILTEIEEGHFTKDFNLNVKPLIEKFLKRELHKRYHKILLEQFGIVKIDKKTIIRIRKVLEDIEHNKNVELSFIITRDILPPVFTKDVQASIRVINRRGKEIPLAEYLGFSIDRLLKGYEDVDVNEELDKYNEPGFYLEIFAPKNTNENLKKEIEEHLDSEFSRQ
ncbi:hypothetical protein PAP_00830 [Palaeococcus pacificus DY20341]|uniref:HD domain-containing protein n=1 Tax=Palaeococcus pacificus DY20341 TaxID=1343739 RepID=A0A075LQP7_9EURY|nr:HD domain-containing protein [Palaeococcus pacificus]AIF68609.1 hypothetical protein PAP_00830 [Palaeococcus pacificus DY20341]